MNDFFSNYHRLMVCLLMSLFYEVESVKDDNDINTERKWSGNGQLDPRHSVPGDDFQSGEMQSQDDGPQ